MPASAIMPTQNLSDGGAREPPGGVMASSRTTYRDRSGGAGATAPGDTFVWVSLRDPSAEELASVQREFGNLLQAN
jgi:hypothetical protein